MCPNCLVARRSWHNRFLAARAAPVPSSKLLRSPLLPSDQVGAMMAIEPIRLQQHTAPIPQHDAFGGRHGHARHAQHAAAREAASGGNSNGSGNGLSGYALPAFGSAAVSIAATPEDRQRHVAKLLSRAESFSLQEEDRQEYELTPDDVDSPHHSPPSRAMVAASAPPELSFTKAEVTPARPGTSGLAGIHRPALHDGRPVIQTPNRYAEDIPVASEYSNSGKKKGRFKCSIFLPVPNVHCVQMELKAGTTAAQAVTQVIAEYLRSHTQPAISMLGQPSAYRLYLAEDDGELDDSFPPLDPTCVVSTTGADCFLLQKRAHHVVAAPSGSIPAAASVSGVGGVAAQPAPSGGGRRISGMNVDDSGDGGGSSGASSYLGGGNGYLQRNAHSSSSPRAGGTGVRKSHRTSSDADDEYAAAADAEAAAEDEPRSTGRSGRSRDITRPRGSSATGSSGPSSRDSSVERPPPAKSKSFSTFSFKACLRCACFNAVPEETEPIEPVERRSSVQQPDHQI